MPNSRNDDFEIKEFDNETLRLILKHRSSQFPILEITSPNKGAFKENNTITVAGPLWSDNFDNYGTGTLVQKFYIKKYKTKTLKRLELN